MNSKDKLDALVQEVLDKGKLLKTFGDYDPKEGEGHSVSLIGYDGLWVVFEKNDGEENHLLLPNEDDAHEALSEIKDEIEGEVQ